jgi:quinol monooxygenase YgiN
MSGQTIVVVSTHQARSGKEAELKQALTSLIEPTRKEAGCINYDLHVSPEYPRKFMFHETWTSKEHFEAHLKSALIKVLLPHLNELCERFPDIEIWEKLRGPENLEGNQT